MKKTLVIALLALVSMGASAEQKKDSVKSNKPVFTVVKEN